MPGLFRSFQILSRSLGFLCPTSPFASSGGPTRLRRRRAGRAGRARRALAGLGLGGKERTQMDRGRPTQTPEQPQFLPKEPPFLGPADAYCCPNAVAALPLTEIISPPPLRKAWARSESHEGGEAITWTNCCPQPPCPSCRFFKSTLTKGPF